MSDFFLLRNSRNCAALQSDGSPLMLQLDGSPVVTADGRIFQIRLLIFYPDPCEVRAGASNRTEIVIRG